ncbi:hypothetical protein YN1_8440 [Nanoarchaeota archaeon]
MGNPYLVDEYINNLENNLRKIIYEGSINKIVSSINTSELENILDTKDIDIKDIVAYVSTILISSYAEKNGNRINLDNNITKRILNYYEKNLIICGIESAVTETTINFFKNKNRLKYSEEPRYIQEIKTFLLEYLPIDMQNTFGDIKKIINNINNSNNKRKLRFYYKKLNELVDNLSKNLIYLGIMESLFGDVDKIKDEYNKVKEGLESILEHSYKGIANFLSYTIYEFPTEPLQVFYFTEPEKLNKLTRALYTTLKNKYIVEMSKNELDNNNIMRSFKIYLIKKAIKYLVGEEPKYLRIENRREVYSQFYNLLIDTRNNIYELIENDKINPEYRTTFETFIEIVNNVENI